MMIVVNRVFTIYLIKKRSCSDMTLTNKWVVPAVIVVIGLLVGAALVAAHASTIILEVVIGAYFILAGLVLHKKGMLG